MARNVGEVAVGRLSKGSLIKRLGQLGRADEANALLTTALLLVPMLGMLGLATDTAQWYLWKRQLQGQADSAALAGAYAAFEGRNSNQLRNIVEADIALNSDRAYTIAAVENPPSAGSKAGRNTAVRVVLTTQEALPFSSFFRSTAPVIRAVATAEFTGVPPTCVLALDTGNQTALSTQGSATVSLGCAMMTNAVGATAASFGNSPVNATYVRAVGGISAGSGLSQQTVVQPYQAAQRDPYASLANPTWPGSPAYGWRTVNSNTTANLSPGYYTGLEIRGIANLAPGVYVIGSGGLTTNAGATINGTGVTFIFTSSATPFSAGTVGRAKLVGGARTNLTAPTTGTYAGILMYQDRRASANNGTSMQISGNSGSTLQGAIYAPATEVQFTGNAGLDTRCAQVIGRYVTFTGNSNFQNVCPPSSGAGAFGGGASARLVE